MSETAKRQLPLLRVQAPPAPPPRPGSSTGEERLDLNDLPRQRAMTGLSSAASPKAPPTNRVRSSTVSVGSRGSEMGDSAPRELNLIITTAQNMQKHIKGTDRWDWGGFGMVKDSFTGKDAMDCLRKQLAVARNEQDALTFMRKMLQMSIIVDAKVPSSKLFNAKSYYSWNDISKWPTVDGSSNTSFRRAKTDMPIMEADDAEEVTQPAVEARRTISGPKTAPKPATGPTISKKAEVDSDRIYDPIDADDWEDVKASDSGATVDSRRPPSPTTRPVSTVSTVSEAAVSAKQAPPAAAPGFTNQPAVRISWSSRPEVIQAGLLSAMSREEIVLQESLFELVSSEESYLADLKILIEVVYNALKVVASQYDFMLQKQQRASALRDKVQSLQSSAVTLQKYGQKFLEELKARRDESLVVQRVSDIFYHWINVFGLSFYDYYRNFVPLKAWAHSSAKELSVAVERTDIHHQVKGRLVDGFLMVACQRIMRYPMLLKEICKNMKKVESFAEEREQLESLSRNFDEICSKCNTLVAFSEGRMELEVINGLLDWKNMMESKNVADSDTRILVKRETLELVKVQGEKIVKSQPVELLLMSDCLICVKQLKKKDADTVKLQVWHYFPRQMVSCYDRSSVEGRELFMLEAYVSGERELLNFAAKSKASKKAWLTLMTAPEEEGVYEAWDCPIAKVIKDFTPTSADEIMLLADDYVKIIERGEVRSKGIVENGDIHPRQGYFPNSHIQEVPSMHDARKQLVSEGKLQHGRRSAVDVGRKLEQSGTTNV